MNIGDRLFAGQSIYWLLAVLVERFSDKEILSLLKRKNIEMILDMVHEKDGSKEI